MKPNYNNFLKTWSTENKITSFFGSDKPDFLKAWGDVKNQAVKKKEVIMKPKEEEINYYKKVENMSKEERSKLLSELRKATERKLEIKRLKSKKAELEREELDKIILSPLYLAVKTFIENEQIRKADEARNNRMKPKQIIIQDEPKETEDFMTVIKDGKKRIVMDEPKEEDPDIISAQLQQLIYITPFDKIRKALVDLKYKGRMNNNKVLLALQLLQNFNTIDKQKQLINKLKS
jgi:hypothetical protein